MGEWQANAGLFVLARICRTMEQMEHCLKAEKTIGPISRENIVFSTIYALDSEMIAMLGS